MQPAVTNELPGTERIGLATLLPQRLETTLRRVGESERWRNLSQAIRELSLIHCREPADAAHDQAIIQGEELHPDDARHLQSRGLMVDANILRPRLIACIGDHRHDGMAFYIESAPA
jgi:hypothetical protein